MSLSRRSFVRLGGASAVGATLLGVAGCDDAGREATAGNQRPVGKAKAKAGSKRPVVEHKYGTTQVPAGPERVVAMGFTDKDPVLAHGVTPVAVRRWYPGTDYPSAYWPWARDELDGATAQVLQREPVNFEEIAALRPDLITAVYAGFSKSEYDQLSNIAPTVFHSGSYRDYQSPWQEMTRQIGRALGREHRSKALVADVEERFARARRQHPRFQRATAAAVVLYQGAYIVRLPDDPRGRFLTSLGFTYPDKIAELPGELGSAKISKEQVGILGDLDVLVLFTPDTGQQPKDDRLYQQLAVARQGRDVVLPANGVIAGSLSFSTVLSLPYALDKLVPILAAAVDGDPATKT